ncbi:hypothetical protein PRUPE_1G085600 [Prunus persica]|uniref:Uncharacterized protein n=1 Tax=Prunus persica TaxID=3760 RepID=A0A251QVE4_PRUPE|nr:hypothetical protein PRUPE_1G085600 [Prunus persica]
MYIYGPQPSILLLNSHCSFALSMFILWVQLSSSRVLRIISIYLSLSWLTSTIHTSKFDQQGIRKQSTLAHKDDFNTVCII